ncbi:hypothetical protein RDn1_056 [Candidatus Termititenax dinenymphae]|uniref:Uncharacterized protein n=1 Tax=Candidatus Termititenax dinenymphae TaxID=2218523 RepID=A0A388TJA6_9BACT|nr:hypothetical protein RDn1_056 [Candidatus Termititenax dinenymphae]
MDEGDARWEQLIDNFRNELSEVTDTAWALEDYESDKTPVYFLGLLQKLQEISYKTLSEYRQYLENKI